MASVWINDRFEDEATASLSLRDTGLLHAAGVFTTMRSYRGRVFRLAQHLQRLRASCEALFIPLQYRDEQLSEAVAQLLERNNLADARLRLTVTRGQAQQDPLHGMHLQPTVFLTGTQLQPYPQEFYERGMTVLVLDEQKLNPYDIQAGHKTLNYLSRLTALREATRRGGGEALWFNVHNYLQSGSICNVFIVKQGELITPPTPQDLQDAALRADMPYPRSAVLPGITRQTILEICRAQGIQTRLAAITISELLEADEVFLSNSAMQVMPVSRVEGHIIGSERPGELTQRLIQSYQELTERDASA
jgi:branched-chain amino acid aminotransferase